MTYFLAPDEALESVYEDGCAVWRLRPELRNRATMVCKEHGVIIYDETFDNLCCSSSRNCDSRARRCTCRPMFEVEPRERARSECGETSSESESVGGSE